MQQMAAWQSLALWDDDSVLGEIPIVEGQPEFKLTLEGSTSKLRASLTACYTPEVAVVDTLTPELREQVLSGKVLVEEPFVLVWRDTVE